MVVRSLSITGVASFLKKGAMVMQEKESADFVVTTAGRRVEVVPVSQRLLDKAVAQVERDFRAKNPEVDPPWYWSVEPSKSDGSDGEKIYWDAASIAKDGSNEEIESWKKHQDALNRLEDAKNLKALEIILLRGIKNEQDKKPDPTWVKDMETLGIELPTDPQELSLEFIQIEVLSSPIDLIQVQKKVSLLNLKNVANPEDIAAVEATFRDVMEEAIREYIGQNFSDLTPRNGTEAKQVGDVDLRPEEERLTSSEILGN